MKEYLLYATDFNKFKKILDGHVFYRNFNEINDTIRRVRMAVPARDKTDIEGILAWYDITPFLKLLADNKNKP